MEQIHLLVCDSCFETGDGIETTIEAREAGWRHYEGPDGVFDACSESCEDSLREEMANCA